MAKLRRKNGFEIDIEATRVYIQTIVAVCRMSDQDAREM